MRPVFVSRVSQPFADPGSYASRSDRHGPAGHHTGVDYGSRWPLSIDNRRVRSVMRGRVVISEFNSTMGHWVGVYNEKHDLLVTYWHMNRRTVKVGARVRIGQTVGRVGSTGNSSAPHLHEQVNRGPAFDYHGHLPPAIANSVIKRAVVRHLLRRRRRR